MHGVVRWRRVDLRDELQRRSGVALHERSVGKVLAKLNRCETLRSHHHRMGQVSSSLAPRVMRLCQAKANVASSRAPMPTGTIR